MSVAPNVRSKPRRDNRREQLLEAAAHCFSEVGYDEASMRDIATEANMLSGSLYYHFKSKEELFLAVYNRGMSDIRSAVEEAIETKSDPYERLRAACVAQIRMMLSGSSFVGVAGRMMKINDDNIRERVLGFRDTYEDIFRQLIAELPLAPDVNRKFLRLTLLGALNYTQNWYHAGEDKPEVIAEKILDVFFEYSDTSGKQ